MPSGRGPLRAAEHPPRVSAVLALRPANVWRRVSFGDEMAASFDVMSVIMDKGLRASGAQVNLQEARRPLYAVSR